MNVVGPWPQLETPRQSQSPFQIVQEVKSLNPTDPDPAVAAQTAVSHFLLSQTVELIATSLKRMPPLSEPGPLGMRVEHRFDFGEQAGDSNLFVQLVAHIAAAAVQAFSLAVPQIWPSHTSGKTHWWPSATPHDVIPSQSCPQVSRGCQERVGQVRRPPSKWRVP